MRKSLVLKDKHKILIGFLPSILLIFIFFILPIVLNFYYSFTDWNAYSSEINFVGLVNFRELFKQKVIFQDLFVTFKYALFVMIGLNVGGFILALALEESSRINGILRTIIFIPVLISSMAAGYIFKSLYMPEGVINQILSFIIGRNINFAYLGSLKFTLFFLSLIHIWKWVGIPLLVYIAGLNTIPKELIEAAKLEGAGFFGILKNIKIPLIGPSFTFSVTTSFIGAFSFVDIILAVTRGGPARTTEVLNMYILTEFGSGRWGYTTSISMFLFLLACFFAVPLVMYLRKREVEL